MAGIGFKLQKLLSGDDYSSTLKAYGFSTVITAGPFLMTVFLVLFVQYISVGNLTDRGMAYLQSLITYCYAFSLVTVGVSYLVVTRYVADEYYRGHVTSFSATFFSVFTLNMLFWGPWVFWYFAGLGVGWGMRLNAFLLYAFAVGIWLAMIFLSCAHNFKAITRAFLWGTGASMVASFLWGRLQGLPGYFGGFVLGQGVVFLGLSLSMLREFGYWEAQDHSWVRYFRLHPRLAATGFFFNLGIWADKFLFWASPQGEWLDPRLRYCWVYDSPMFFSYLSILPSMVYFFLQVETDFFFKYHDYYKGIQDQKSMAVLERRRQDIVRSLNYSLGRLVVFQGIISVFVVLVIPWITRWTGLQPLQMSVLRVGVYSSYMQAACLILINIILYFDHQQEALLVAGTFCLANAVLTHATLDMGLFSFGYGYGVACMLATGVGIYFLNERLRLLHYWTFSRQGFPEPVAVLDEQEAEL
ncbi:MAG: exopolysaccharide Pel transporter PelG [Elusimicrobia bacterium]|nr:exopolysaccharide Pel transporter PelG [Elusimicrobiota bacterium]